MQPVHSIHIRKTGGTSLNHSFFALSGENPAEIWDSMREGGENIVSVGPYTYVTRDKSIIESGDYTYSHAHIPYRNLNFRKEVFTICGFRDPVNRVLSHYKMVEQYNALGVQKEWLRTERQWLGEGLVDFCENMPREKLLGQLYCFSENEDVNESIQRVSEVSFIFNISKFEKALSDLSDVLGVQLQLHHERSIIATPPKAHELQVLREMLEPEYEFIHRLGPRF